jgi:hypothetical protein
LFLLHAISSFSQQFQNIAPILGIQHTVDTELVFGGHGVSFFDFDNDGWDDITFVQENDSIVLYKNNNGIFEKIQSVEFQSGEIRQALWVDYDNDGDNDLIITATNGVVKLHRNNGDGTFSDVSLQAGLSEFPANNYGVSFADYNLDGHLDFYLARYQMTGSDNNPTLTNALYRNNGNGTFSNVTEFAGVGDSIQPSFMGIWIDINRDLYPDLYVINDRVLWGNTLYLNNGDGTFTDYTISSGLEMFGEDPMGATFGDYDNDGDLDIILSNGGPPTKPIRLYTNNGDSTFFENAGDMNIDVPVTFMCTWGGSWIDANNDTYLDLYMTTGFLLQATGEVRNYLFMSNNGLSFTDSPLLFEGNHVAASYSVAKGDIDNDGYADLVVQNAKNYNSFIWKNNYGPTTNNNYIKVTLEGTQSNKMAIGSWITLYCDNQVLTHYTRCGESFISQDSQHHIFGLGNHSIVDSLIVEFPSGIINKYYNLDVNQHVYLTETSPVHEISVPQNTLCEGDTLWIDGGNFDSILWNNGWAEQFLPVTESGSYSVTIINQVGATVESNVLEITFIPPPSISSEISHESCTNFNDGSIQLNVSTLSTNHTINWSNGMSGSSIQNLAAGGYSYQYTDPAGCSSQEEFEILEAIPLVVFTNITPSSVESFSDLQIIIFGGQAPYIIYLDGELIDFIHTNIAPGNYTLQIIDDNGCVYEEQLIFESLGINSQTLSNQQIWFPNPNTDGKFLTTNLKNISIIDIVDFRGARINYDITDENLQILAGPGTYFVLFELNKKQVLQKLVIL